MFRIRFHGRGCHAGRCLAAEGSLKQQRVEAGIAEIQARVDAYWDDISH